MCQIYHGLSNRVGRTRWYSEVTRLKWKLISVRLVIVLILSQDRCTVYAERTIGSEIILDATDGTPSDVGHVDLVLVHLKTELASVQDRCMVYVIRTIGSEIIFDAPDGTPS
jgi:hypothetical protein